MKDQSIAKLLKANDSKTNPKGETLRQEMRVYRFDLVENCLAAGVPLAKVDSLRPFLEKYGHRIRSHSHLSEMIPAVLAKEKETLKSELSGAKFDGSTRLGEALAIIVRYIDGNWNLEQRLVSFQTLAKSLKNDELAKCLLECLAVNYSIKPTGLLAAMKDGAAVNKAAIRQIQFYFPQAFSVTCFSHTIDNVEKHFEFRVLDKFIMYWTAMFSNSPAVRLAWKDRTGKAMRSHSKTRWGSQFEIVKQVFEYYGDVEPFLRENDHLATATRGHLLELFNNQNDAADLKLELAALIDGGVHFVTGTYNLEGDGPLVFTCYEHLSTIVNAISVGSFPNVEALARQRADGDQRLFNELTMQAKACINPGFRFFSRSLVTSFIRWSELSEVPAYAVLFKYSSCVPLLHL